MNIEYKYIKYPNLYKYDFNFTKDLYFEYETKYDNATFTLSEKCRSVISINNIKKYIYISTLKEKEIDDGFILSCVNCDLLLINIGENVFYLASCDSKDELIVNSMVYTFMSNHNCIIDVNKYKFLFKDTFSIPLFVKSN